MTRFSVVVALMPVFLAAQGDAVLLGKVREASKQLTVEPDRTRVEEVIERWLPFVA